MKLAIQTMRNGEVRLLSLPLADAHNPGWSSDGRRITLLSAGAQGRAGLFQVDVETGALATVLDPESQVCVRARRRNPARMERTRQRGRGGPQAAADRQEDLAHV